MGESSSDVRLMKLRYAGTCRVCSAAVPARAEAAYFAADKQIECLDCFEPNVTPTVEEPAPETADPVPLPPAESGIAGASAKREFDRRAAKREQRVREKHPRIGGFLLAMSDDPQSTKAWSTGSVGEVKLGARLDGLAPQGVLVLHDRRIPGTKANIDHIVGATSGVWVIDAKKYAGRPQLRVEGGILRPRVEKLLVGTRDQTKLVAGVEKQVGLVREALERGGYGDVPVSGMLCFVEADWPLFGGDFRIAGIDVLWPKKAEEIVCQPGTLDSENVIAIQRYLASEFPIA